MEEDTIQSEALQELEHEARRDAIESAKNLIREIVKQQEIIANAQIKIGNYQIGLAEIKVKEFKI